MNDQELLDELYKFKSKFNLSEEENKNLDIFIDSIVQKIQKINKKLNKNNVKKIAKTIETILREADDG